VGGKGESERNKEWDEKRTKFDGLNELSNNGRKTRRVRGEIGKKAIGGDVKRLRGKSEKKLLKLEKLGL
jgi:hypothetical protein